MIIYVNWDVNHGLLNASTFSILGRFPGAQGTGIFNASMSGQLYDSTCFVLFLDLFALGPWSSVSTNTKLPWKFGIGWDEVSIRLSCKLLFPRSLLASICLWQSKSWSQVHTATDSHVNETDLRQQLCHANAQRKTTLVGMFIKEDLLVQRFVSIQLHSNAADDNWQLICLYVLLLLCLFRVQEKMIKVDESETALRPACRSSSSRRLRSCSSRCLGISFGMAAQSSLLCLVYPLPT